MHLRGTGTFRPVSPVVFVAVAEGIAGCEQLAAAVRRGPLDVDLTFPYHPHVTVAHELDETVLDQVFDDLAGFECRFDVDAFHLYVHDEQHGWQPTDEFPLGRPAARRPAGEQSWHPRKERLTEIRERRPLVDHLVRMQEHYGEAKASQQAGAITYFAFLSFFPMLALSFFAVGVVSDVYPDANAHAHRGDRLAVPGHDRPRARASCSSRTSAPSAAWRAPSASLGVLYAGLGWISALRTALVAVFEPPEQRIPNFVMGKVRDLLTLVVIGLTLLVAVALTGLVASFSTELLGWLGLGDELAWLVKLLTVVLGLAANALLFFTMFRLLGEPLAPRISLVKASLLGAVLFEVLKQVSGKLIASTQGQPAFQAFGIALVLVVWINYFSRVVLYAAAFAHTAPEARALRPDDEPAPVQGPPLPSGADAPAGTVGPGQPEEPAGRHRCPSQPVARQPSASSPSLVASAVGSTDAPPPRPVGP